MEQTPFFPLYIDMSKRRVVFFGGGKIATRRILVLQPFTQQVEVYSPEITSELQELVKAKTLIWRQSSYEPEFLGGADIVFAATGDADMDRQIAMDCRERGIAVNAASDRGLCDFYFPGIVQKNETVVGINASGVDHRRAKDVRIKIEEMLAEELPPKKE